jgi:hypothetical protein
MPLANLSHHHQIRLQLRRYSQQHLSLNLLRKIFLPSLLLMRLHQSKHNPCPQ